MLSSVFPPLKVMLPKYIFTDTENKDNMAKIIGTILSSADVEGCVSDTPLCSQIE